MKNGNVTTLVSFEKIEPSDLKGGFSVYSDIERQVDSLREGVAPWVYSIAYHFFEKSLFIPLAAAEDFKIAMEEQVEWITSEAAGGKRLTGKQAKLKGRSPLAAAYRKMHNTLIMEGDLRKLTSVSQCEDFNKKANEVAKAKEAKAAMDKAINNKCKADLLRSGAVSTDVNWETDETAKLLLSGAVEEYKQQREQGKGEHLDVIEGSSESNDKPTVELDKFDEMGAKFAESLRSFYNVKSDEFGEQNALKEVQDRFTASIKKLQEAMEKSINNLKRTLQKTG